MYLPAHFEENRPDVLHALMREYPLATIVTGSENGPEANHVPLHLVAASPGAPMGVLQGHVARANPLCMREVDCWCGMIRFGCVIS